MEVGTRRPKRKRTIATPVATPTGATALLRGSTNPEWNQFKRSGGDPNVRRIAIHPSGAAAAVIFWPFTRCTHWALHMCHAISFFSPQFVIPKLCLEHDDFDRFHLPPQPITINISDDTCTCRSRSPLYWLVV